MAEIIFVENYNKSEKINMQYLKEIFEKLNYNIDKKIYYSRDINCIIAAKILGLYNKVDIEMIESFTFSNISNSAIDLLTEELNKILPNDKNLPQPDNECGISKKMKGEKEARFKNIIEILKDTQYNDNIVLLPGSVSNGDVEILNIYDNNDGTLKTYKIGVDENKQEGLVSHREINKGGEDKLKPILDNIKYGHEFNFIYKEYDHCRIKQLAKNILIIITILSVFGGGGYMGYNYMKGGRKKSKKK